MDAIDSGGTMTESSNYDASLPAPPAYGVWRMVADSLDFQLHAKHALRR